MSTYAMRLGMTYTAELNAYRTRELKRVLNDFKGFPLDSLAGLCSGAFKEDYLLPLLTKMYKRVGSPIAQMTYDKLAKKSIGLLEAKARPKPNPIWNAAIDQFVLENGTSKIATISGTMKDFVFSTVQNATQQVAVSGVGIEKATQELIKGVLSDWSGGKEWMARRIMLTESLTAMSVSADASARSLELPMTKTWVTAGINTREAHAAMDGQTIDMNEYFFPDGEQMSFPRDGSFGASAGNIINCSCAVIYDTV